MQCSEPGGSAVIGGIVASRAPVAGSLGDTRALVFSGRAVHARNNSALRLKLYELPAYIFHCQSANYFA
jgi:hypothetical protein